MDFLFNVFSFILSVFEWALIILLIIGLIRFFYILFKIALNPKKHSDGYFPWWMW